MVVYLTTNLINNKKYIGSDSKNNPRYLGSGTWIKKAIKKYGRENFKKEILEYCKDIEHLKEREEYWIDKYDAFNSSMFYNATKLYRGNSNITQKHRDIISQSNKNHKYNLGRKLSPKHIESIVKSNLGKKRSEETKKKLSKAKMGNSYALNYKFTQEGKDKISKMKKGHICYQNPERKIKIGKANKGKIRTEEHKLNYSKSQKNRNHPKYRTNMLDLEKVKEKYNDLSTPYLAKYFNVSVGTMRSFLKDNNLFEFRKNYKLHL